MKHIVKLIAMMFVTLFSVGVAFASPITVEGLNVQEVGTGGYVVLTTLENQNSSTGQATKLYFTIEELGTQKDMGFVEVGNESMVESYNLQEITDNFGALKKGETYTVTAETGDGSSMSTAFLFGSEQDTEGLDLIIEKVEVNGNDVTDLDSLQVENGDNLQIQVRFSALESFDDARLMTFIDGYEHSPLISSTEIFKAVEGVTYVKTMNLNLPADMNSEKPYKLRLTGANDLSGLTYKELELYVDTQRDRVDVLDLIMTPSSGVEPGQNIIANVRMKNRGQQEQDSVKATVEIPQLGVSESSYISNLDPEEVATSDDMLIFVPEDAKAGQYQALVTLAYDDGYTRTTESFTLNVLAPRTVQEQNLIVSYNDNVELQAGEETSFDIVIGNPNSESKPISIASAGAAWADVEVTPGLAMVQGGGDATFRVTVTPKDTVEGERALTLLVKEGNEQVSEISFQTYVEAEDSNLTNIILAALLVIAIIVLLVLIVAIARRRNAEEDERVEYDDASTSSEEYY